VYRNDGRGILLPALTGPIVFHKTTSDLIDAGWLSRPSIIMPQITGNVFGYRYQTIYNKSIVFNANRNKIGVTKIFEEVDQGHLSVAFFRNVAKHLPILRDMIFKKLDKSIVGEIHGITPGTKRIELLNKFRNHDLMLLLLSVGTSGEGFDLPGETEFGVNFVGGSSEIMIRQLLGRLLRKPRDPVLNDVDPSVEFRVRYLDFYDDTHRMMRDQSDNRMNIYKSEPAFKFRLL
jgi:superfamily II DNA or RNA helicase